jgi:hypothetical protein
MPICQADRGEKSTAILVDTAVLIAVAAIALPVSRGANQSTSNCAHRAADNRISSIVATGQCPDRGPPEPSNHSAFLGVRAAGEQS